MISLACCAAAGATGVSPEEVLLVGSRQIHFDEISKTKLRDLYTGQSQMVGNAQVLVIDRQKEFGEREQFIHGTLGFTEEEFQTVQRLLECIGISKAPTMAKDSKHMIDMLANNTNALGYVSRRELQQSNAVSRLRHIKVLAE